MAAARDVGAKSYRTVYCQEVAACASSVPQAKYAAGREGLKYSSESASAVAADYTAACLSAKNAGVDWVQSSGLNFANLVRDCARQNFHPFYGVGGAASQANIGAAKGESLSGNLFEWGAFYSGPENARFRQAAATTDLTYKDATLTQTAVQSWLGFDMAGAIISKLTQAKPTRADFLEATLSIKGETLGGQVPPMDYTMQRPGTGLHSSSDCWTEVLVKDDKYYHMDKNGQIVNGITYVCGTGWTYRIGQGAVTS